jgi:hypothetical protein
MLISQAFYSSNLIPVICWRIIAGNLTARHWSNWTSAAGALLKGWSLHLSGPPQPFHFLKERQNTKANFSIGRASAAAVVVSVNTPT